MNNLNPELENWTEIIMEAGGGNDDRRTAAQVKAIQKLTFSIANLRQTIFHFQKVAVPRLDQLRQSIDRFNDSSTKLYWINIALTSVIAIATLANVLVVIFKR